MLSRRSLMLAPALFAPHIARAQARRLRMGHNNTTDSIIHLAATTTATALHVASNGRLLIDVSPNSILGSEVQMVRAVAEGSLDLAVMPVGAAAVLAKEIDLTEAPYLFTGPAQARTALDGRLGDACAELLRPKGVAVLAWAEVGVRHMTANKPVRTPADLNGLHIRVPVSEVILQSFEVMGAKPGTLPFGELPEALRTGRFEAQENPVSIIVGAHLNQHQSHLSLTGHVYTALPIIASVDVLDELPEADRRLLVDAAHAGVTANRNQSTRLETEGLDTIRKGGTAVVEDVDRKAFLAQADAILARLQQSFGADVVKRIRGAVA